MEARIARDWWTPDVLNDVSDCRLSRHRQGVKCAFIGGERHQETTWGQAIKYHASPFMVIPCCRFAQHHGRREVSAEILLSRSCAWDETSRKETGGRGERKIHAEDSFTRQAETAVRDKDGSERGSHCQTGCPGDRGEEASTGHSEGRPSSEQMTSSPQYGYGIELCSLGSIFA